MKHTNWSETYNRRYVFVLNNFRRGWLFDFKEMVAYYKGNRGIIPNAYNIRRETLKRLYVKDGYKLYALTRKEINDFKDKILVEQI